MTTFCVDFDDLCDVTADRLDMIRDLKEKYRRLKVTLFTIPVRTSAKTIKKAKELDSRFSQHWLQLAPHGWRHTRGECLSWTAEEAEDKIRRAAEMGIDAPVFRAPAWLLDGDVYEACGKMGYVVASHRKFRVAREHGAREYIYNQPIASNIRGVHGHMTTNQAIDNFIGDMLSEGRLNFPRDAQFVFPQDVAEVIPCEF